MDEKKQKIQHALENKALFICRNSLNFSYKKFGKIFIILFNFCKSKIEKSGIADHV